MITEIWKRIEIEDVKTNYEVSSEGRVRSLGFNGIKEKTGGKLVRYPQPIKKSLNIHTGYLAVGITYAPRKSKTKVVHRLVANAFLKNPQNKPEVNHINGIKTDNRAINLEWVTAKENTRHRFEVLGQDNRGKINNKRSKPIIQLDIKTGLEIATFPCAMEAQRQIGVWGSSARQCAYGKINHAGGFKWKFV